MARALGSSVTVRGVMALRCRVVVTAKCSAAADRQGVRQHRASMYIMEGGEESEIIYHWRNRLRWNSIC